MARTHLIILPTRGFSEEDLVNFLDILNGKIYVAIPFKKVAIAKYGSKVYPDFSTEEIFLLKDTFFDSLIVIADKGFREFIDSEIASIFTRFYHAKKPVILSSLAQIAFAKMDLLLGRTITFNVDEFPEYLKTVLKLKVRFADLPYVVDGNLITTKGRDAIYDLEDSLLELLAIYK